MSSGLDCPSMTGGLLDAELVELGSRSEEKGVVAGIASADCGEEEVLSMRIIDLRLGTVLDDRFSGKLSRSSMRSFRSGVFDRGALYGSFVVELMTRCDAVRCDMAAMTCVDVKAGFKGT
jgi:hypothetical protein